MLGKIYLITNIVNDKKYVGQTVQNGKRRFNTHKRDALKHQSPLPLHRAILAKQYGVGETAIDKVVRRDTWEHI